MVGKYNERELKYSLPTLFLDEQICFSNEYDCFLIQNYETLTYIIISEFNGELLYSRKIINNTIELDLRKLRKYFIIKIKDGIADIYKITEDEFNKINYTLPKMITDYDADYDSILMSDPWP